MRKTLKKVLKGIGNASEKMVREIEKQELAKQIIPREKGFLEKKIITVMTDDGERQIVDLEDSVCFVPRTLDGYYVLSSQYRASRGEVSTSIYGGYIDEGESAQDCAIREMYEECNIGSDALLGLELVNKPLFPSLGICNEKSSTYIMNLGYNKDDLDVKSNDVNETITPVFVTAEQLKNITFDGMKAYFAQFYILNTIELNELRAENTELRELNDIAMSENSNLQRDKDHLEEIVQELEGRLDKRTDERNHFEYENDNLQDVIDKLEHEKAELENKVETLENK